MNCFLSPAKNMKPAERDDLRLTAPRFLERSRALCASLRAKAPYELETLLGTGAPLALRAASFFQDWTDAGGGAAMLSFDGLAYRYLDAPTLSRGELDWAQAHVRLFSAFYGPLRPLDAIRPYRLELAQSVDGQRLYDFWGDTFYRELFADGEPVVNLASNEYSRAVRPYLQPRDRMVTVEFLTCRKGKTRCLPAIAKMARGRMARYIIQNQVESPAQLPFFDWNGFRYEQSLSDNERMAFVQLG